jgi:hypothetical protein
MLNMPLIAIVFGVLLDVLGLGTYVATGMEHPTALIPCVFGTLILVCGVVGRNEKYLKHALHGAAVFGLLGFLAPLGRLVPKAAKGELEWNLAAWSMVVMMGLCGVFLALCVKSFIDVRRARGKV